MATIPNNRIAEFSTAIGNAFSITELSVVCFQATNENLFAMFAGPGKPTIDTAYEMLVKLQELGWEKKVLAVIYNTRSDVPAIRAMIESVYPEIANSASITESAKKTVLGMAVIQEAISKADKKPSIINSRDPLDKLARDVTYLAVYKNLHDSLHQLQIKPYFELRDAAVGFVTDKTLARILILYRNEVLNTLTRARQSIAELPPDKETRDLEEAWIGDLEQKSKDYNDAVDNKDSMGANTALLEISQILSTVPVRLNQEILTKAKSLPLTELTGAIEAISAAVGMDNAQIVQAKNSMRDLGPSITARVAQHKSWQDTDQFISILDNVFDRKGNDILTQFRQYWPMVKKKINALMVTESGANWTVECAKYTIDIDDQVSKDDFSVDLQLAYETLRGSTRSQFFAVDSNLKMECSALKQISAPLLALLESVDHG